MIVRELLDKLYVENQLDKEELIFIIENISQPDYGTLFEYALNTKRRFYGDKVYMRGLIEFSNICRCTCLYCGLRSSNKNIDRYRLSPEEILNACQEGYRLGYRTFVLQSGEDPWFTIDRLKEIIQSIKAQFCDAALTLSIGERSFEEYKIMRDAGADRFLLRHETASPKLYEKLHPGMDYSRRIKCLNDLKELGFQVGAGFMVGLPEQGSVELAEDLMFLKDFEPDMIGIGPFIPHSETPLASASGGSVEKTLVMVALARLLVPKGLIPATTALGTLDEKGREKALKAGANVVMPNLTPLAVRAKYELYENKICTGDEAAHCRVCIEERIKSAGFEVDMGRGDHVNKNF